MVLKVYNSLTKKKEEFIPLIAGKVGMYTCGQTVYDELHIGNARTYSNWDVITRYLRYKGYEVLHVQNFTDVGHLVSDADWGEDKIVRRAAERQMHPMELVEKQIANYFKDTAELKIKRPNIMPRATGHILEMIDLVKALLEKGFAYETPSGVYFDISKFSDYGKLSGVDLTKQQAGARIEADQHKRNPLDFALWIKADPSHIMQWNSPWGSGYPGWHLECSVMSMKYIGETLDIHGGGKDHLGTHHPNERAQSEAYTGKPFVRYWLHSEFLNMESETGEAAKMSKSKGLFITARELIDKYGGDLVRFYLVSAHYRSPLTFSERALLQAKESFVKLQTTFALVRSIFKNQSTEVENPSPEALQFKEEFEKAMDDDFNTPKALSVLYAFSTHINKLVERNAEKPRLRADYELFLKLAAVLAIEPPPITPMEQLVEWILELREEARQTKNFELADRIRVALGKLGYVVEDKPWGAIYRKN
ncbi:MAG: cysteine--tRNA ligase [Candidatus Heimdallarchaeota archaeon]